MNYGEPSLSAADFRTIRRRLAERGVEMAGDAQFHWKKISLEHDMSRPHVMLECVRVNTGVIPDFEVAGYADCLFCRQLIFLSGPDILLLQRADVIPLCADCRPAHMGGDHPGCDGLQEMTRDEVHSFVRSVFGLPEAN